MRARKVCAHPGCANLQPCEEHAKKPWEGSERRENIKLSGSREQKRARHILRKHDTICHVCGRPGSNEVDHVIPLSFGGEDDLDNLRPIHAKPCHEEKTRRESRRAPSIEWEGVIPDSLFILALVGQPGAGKTWLRSRLDVPSKGIDECGVQGDYRTRWSNMLGWLSRQADIAVVESCVVPPEFAGVLESHRSLVAEVVADPEVRAQRLKARGDEAMTEREIGFRTDLELEADEAGAKELERTLRSAMKAAYAD